MSGELIEFVGGPNDGKRLHVDSRTELIVVFGCSGQQIVEHEYKLRRVEGIAVRMPSGFFAYDWIPRG